MIKEIIKSSVKIIVGDKKYNQFSIDNSMKKLSKNNHEQLEELQKNKIYKNKHKGQRCFVLGNGPSLNTHDLSFLENEIVFTVNQIARHKDFLKIKPTYHFWADPIFFNLDISKPSEKELFDTMKSVKTKDNNPTCFYEMEAYDMIKKTGLDKDLNIAYYKHGLPLDKMMNNEIDLCKMIPAVHTVVQYAILTAIYMGFSEIYFMGCEMTGILSSLNKRLNNADTNVYAYNITENENRRMNDRLKKISLEQELYSFYKVISDYRLLNEYCLKNNIKLFNCTRGGLVEGVDRVNYEGVFNKI